MALKHGKSTEIWVKIEWLKQKINIIVKDNGIGFDPENSERKIIWFNWNAGTS